MNGLRLHCLTERGWATARYSRQDKSAAVTPLLVLHVLSSLETHKIRKRAKRGEEQSLAPKIVIYSPLLLFSAAPFLVDRSAELTLSIFISPPLLLDAARSHCEEKAAKRLRKGFEKAADPSRFSLSPSSPSPPLSLLPPLSYYAKGARAPVVMPRPVTRLREAAEQEKEERDTSRQRERGRDRAERRRKRQAVGQGGGREGGGWGRENTCDTEEEEPQKEAHTDTHRDTHSRHTHTHTQGHQPATVSHPPPLLPLQGEKEADPDDGKSEATKTQEALDRNRALIKVRCIRPLRRPLPGAPGLGAPPGLARALTCPPPPPCDRPAPGDHRAAAVQQMGSRAAVRKHTSALRAPPACPAAWARAAWLPSSPVARCLLPLSQRPGDAQRRCRAAVAPRRGGQCRRRVCGRPQRGRGQRVESKGRPPRPPATASPPSHVRPWRHRVSPFEHSFRGG